MRRTRCRRSAGLGWERLEDRLCPSLTIQLDYSYDTLGFFTQNSSARTVLQQAADILGSRINDSLAAITPGAGNTWTATFLNPSGGSQLSVDNLSIPANTILVYAGGFASSGSFIGFGGPGGYAASGSNAWRNLVATRGANPAIGIWGGAVEFSTGVNWSFAGSSGTPGTQQYDFLTLALHELGHVLGIGTSQGWRAHVNSSSDTFLGPHAQASYGGPVPLNPAGQFGEAADSHWGSSVTSFGRVPALSVNPLFNGQRRDFTSLDWAGLQDIGWHADHLVVTTQPPARIVAGGGFGLTVSVVDPAGHVDPTFHGPITLALAQGPAGAVLGGTLTATAQNGVASFSGLTLGQAGAGLVIQASATLVTPVTTDRIDVTPFSDLPQLTVTLQPPAAVGAGSPFGLTITVEDPYGQVNRAFHGPITLELADGPLGGVLGGTITATASQGVAGFSGLWLNQAGAYTLRAIAAGASSTSTRSVTVSAGPASQLVVTTQPPGLVPFGSNFRFVVTAEDAYGNAVTSFNQILTAGLTSAVGSGFAGGGVVVTAVNGVADFSDFFVGTPGAGYTIRVTASAGGMSVLTTPFSVVKGPLNSQPGGSAATSPIIAERVLTTGKGQRKRLVGFQLDFGVPLDPARAGDPANYLVTRTLRRRRKPNLVAQAVSVMPRYDAASSAVTLLISGKPVFPQGGRIVVKAAPPSGITDAAGASFGSDFLLIIRPGARGLRG